MFRGILCLVKDLFWQDKKQTTWWEEKKGSDRFFSPNMPQMFGQTQTNYSLISGSHMKRWVLFLCTF